MRYIVLLLTIWTCIGVRVFADDRNNSVTKDREVVVILWTKSYKTPPLVITQRIGDNLKVGCQRGANTEPDKLGGNWNRYWTDWKNKWTRSYVRYCSETDASGVCIESASRLSEEEEGLRLRSVKWLRFRPFTNGDIGEYECETEGFHYSVKVRIESTMFRLPPRNITVEEGGKVVFSCRTTSAYNGSAISWNRDGRIATSDDESTTINFNDLGYSTLTIDRVGIEDNQSNFSCSAENGKDGGETETTANARLTVLASCPCEHTPRFPIIDSSGPREIRVTPGREARIPCETGDSWRNAQWWRNSIPLNLSEGRYYQGYDDDALFIRRTQIDDLGTYECHLTNSHGTVYSQPIALLFEDSDSVPPVNKSALIDVFNNSGSITNKTSRRSEGSTPPSPLIDTGNRTCNQQSTGHFEPLWIGTTATLAIVIVGLVALVIHYRRKYNIEKRIRLGTMHSFKNNNAALNYVSNPCYEESSSGPQVQTLHPSMTAAVHPPMESAFTL